MLFVRSGFLSRRAKMTRRKRVSRSGGTTPPGKSGAMALHDFLTDLGLNPNFIIAGTAGGFLRALSRKQFRIREVVFSPICGALAAAYLTEPIIHYARMMNWPLPPEPASITTSNGAAFIVGVIAMWITDIVVDRLMRFVKTTDKE